MSRQWGGSNRCFGVGFHKGEQQKQPETRRMYVTEKENISIKFHENRTTVYLLLQCRSYYFCPPMQSLPIGTIDPTTCVSIFYKTVTNKLNLIWSCLPKYHFLFTILRTSSNSPEWGGWWSSVSVETADCDGLVHTLYYRHPSYAYSCYMVAIRSGILN